MLINLVLDALLGKGYKGVNRLLPVHLSTCPPSTCPPVHLSTRLLIPHLLRTPPDKLRQVLPF